MRSVLFTLRALSPALLGAALCLLAGCPHTVPQKIAEDTGNGEKGEYYAAPNKLYDRDLVFDVRWKLTHEPQTDTFDPEVNVDNRQLAINRCDRCHECGFHQAFDMDHYGKADWHPRIKGQDWSRPAERMIAKENSFLNDLIVERIYNFLRDETTIGYDFSKDKKGAVTVDVDEQGNPIKHERAKTPQK
jgi:hypothetical protein